jgi:hypothetical protein
MAQIFYFPRLRHGGRRPRPASPSRPIQSTSCSRRPAFVRASRAGLGISCRSLVDWIRLSKRLSQVVFFWNPSTRRCPWFMNFSMCDLSAVLSSCCCVVFVWNRSFILSPVYNYLLFWIELCIPTS